MRTFQVTAVFLTLPLLLVAAGCDSSPKPTGEKITLKLNLEKGEMPSIAYDADIDTKVSARGRDIEMRAQMEFSLGVEVEDVDDTGIHSLKVTYDRIKFRIVGGPTAFDYDSANPSGNRGPGGEMLQALAGASLRVKVAPDGTTTDVVWADELVDRLGEGGPPGRAAQLR